MNECIKTPCHLYQTFFGTDNLLGCTTTLNIVENSANLNDKLNIPYRSGIINICGSGLSIFASGLGKASLLDKSIIPACVSGMQEGCDTQFSANMIIYFEEMFNDQPLVKTINRINNVNRNTPGNNTYTGMIHFKVFDNDKVLAQLEGDLTRYNQNLKKGESNPLVKVDIEARIEFRQQSRHILFNKIYIYIEQNTKKKDGQYSDFTGNLAQDLLINKILNQSIRKAVHSEIESEICVKIAEKSKAQLSKTFCKVEKILSKVDKYKEKIDCNLEGIQDQFNTITNQSNLVSNKISSISSSLSTVGAQTSYNGYLLTNCSLATIESEITALDDQYTLLLTNVVSLYEKNNGD